MMMTFEKVNDEGARGSLRFGFGGNYKASGFEAVGSRRSIGL